MRAERRTLWAGGWRGREEAGRGELRELVGARCCVLQGYMIVLLVARCHWEGLPVLTTGHTARVSRERLTVRYVETPNSKLALTTCESHGSLRFYTSKSCALSRRFCIDPNMSSVAPCARSSVENHDTDEGLTVNR